MTSPDGTLPRYLSPRDLTSPTSPQPQTLGVPYTSTTAQKKPLSGQRPLSATTTVNGVPYHERTSTQRPEVQSHRSSKGKFSLLNPVNLLMRRRSSQAVDTPRDDKHASLIVPPMDLPADYDPRIRGKVVHDFSAPRPRRNISYNDADSPPRLDVPLPGDQFQPSSDSSRPPSAEWDARRRSTQHTPVFVEQFDDGDDISDKRASAVTAEALANQNFIARNSWISQESPVLPPFGRKSQQFDDQPIHLPSVEEDKQSDAPPSASCSEVSPLSNAQWDRNNTFQSPISPDTLPTITTPPVSEEVLDVRVPTPSDSPPMPDMQHLSIDGATGQTSGLPKHLKSTSSRFSFQLSGTDSMAEEKILEEKHKLRHSQAVDQSKAPVMNDSDSDYEEDDTFDEDAMYDHDEMEDIGGMEDDMPPANFGTIDGIGRNHNAAALGQLGLPLQTEESPVLGSATEQIYSPNPLQKIIELASSSPKTVHPPQIQAQHLLTQSAMDSATSPKSPNSFYFDDGMIDPIDDLNEEVGFDETKFDDPSFLKRPNQPQHLTEDVPRNMNGMSSTYDVNGYTFLMHNTNTNTTNIPADSPFSEDSADQSEGNGCQKEENPRHDSQDPFDTRGGLSAYHSALADAANKAAADGKFSRKDSIGADSASIYSEEPASGPVFEESFPIQRHSRMMSASTHQSHPSYSGFDFGFNSSPTLDDTFSSPEFPSDDFDYDDLDMVAAANAEALAHDEDGFYSQEFGFYGRPRSDSDVDSAEAFAGGYFGPPGIEIVRQKSLREPNLTPITERSEFSARNSFIGGGMGPFTSMAAALPSSPPFPPQIGRAMSPLVWGQLQEDDMTLADLRRLRQNAFGSSSSSSIRSEGTGSAAGHNQSPLALHQGPGGYFMPPSMGGVPMAYHYSNDSNGSGYGSGYSQSPIASSPAIAMQMPLHMSSPTQIQTHPPHAQPPLLSPEQNQTQAFAMFNDDNQTPRKPPSQQHQQDQFSTPVKNSSSSPAYMQQQQQQLHELPATPPTAMKIKDLPPLSKPAAYKTHSRTGSGADSVTYVREDDDNGKKRWVLERRRTSEQGVLELVGREVLENGRI